MGWLVGSQETPQQECWKACLAENETYPCCLTVLGLQSLTGTAACKQVCLVLHLHRISALNYRRMEILQAVPLHFADQNLPFCTLSSVSPFSLEQEDNLLALLNLVPFLVYYLFCPENRHVKIFFLPMQLLANYL